MPLKLFFKLCSELIYSECINGVPNYYPYNDKTGRRFSLEEGNITIGVGHNLDVNPLSEQVILLQLYDDCTEVYEGCISLFPRFKSFTINRRIALLDMAFQLGMQGLKDFENMVEAINTSQWDIAYKECLDSLYATKHSKRAKTNALKVKYG